MSQINIMALRHSVFYTPLLMSIAGGFLREEGLEPEYRQATPVHTVPDSIREGSCHVAQSAVATGFAELERGVQPDIMHFAQINARDGFFIAAREADPAFNWGKLAGSRVLVDHFFQPMAMLKFALHRKGVDFNDLEVIDAGSVEDIERAYRDGVGDYVHMQGPVPQQLEHEGLGHVVAAVGDAVGPVAFSSLCATHEWLNTDMATAFMRGYRRALSYVIDAPSEEIAAREYEAGFFPGIDLSVLTSTVSAYKALGCWQQDSSISREVYENLLDIFLYSGVITRRHAYEDLIVSFSA